MAVTFGPGSMESITLYERKHVGGPQARVEGTFTIYCGMGNTHTVDINGPWGFRDHLDHLDDVEDEARQLVEYELEDWFDPCQDGGPE